MDFENVEQENNNTFNEQHEENENIEINNLNENKNYRYSNLIKLMGLNDNINYPHNIIIQGIIDMHTEKNSKSVHRHYMLKFKNNVISSKICEILFGKIQYTTTTYVNISRQVRLMQRHYLYEKIYVINNVVNKKDELLGFSYDNLRWKPLENTILEL